MATREVINRGPKGLAAAEQAYLAGRIAEPTEEALAAYLRAPAEAAATSAQQIGEQVREDAEEKIAEVEAALAPLQEIDAAARIAQLEGELAAANSTLELLTLIYPISQFTALGNPVLADGNPLLSGA